jgi:hypothetical protein
MLHKFLDEDENPPEPALTSRPKTTTELGLVAASAPF